METRRGRDGWRVKKGAGRRLSTQSHHRQGYRPDTVSTPCPERPHKSPDRQTRRQTAPSSPPTRAPAPSSPSARVPKVPGGMSPLWPPLGCHRESPPPTTADYSGFRLTRICRRVDLQTSCSGCEYIMKLEGMRTVGVGGHRLSAVSGLSLSLDVPPLQRRIGRSGFGSECLKERLGSVFTAQDENVQLRGRTRRHKAKSFICPC